MTKIRSGRLPLLSSSPPPFPTRNRVKVTHFQHSLHKSYLHKTTQKNYLEKFIEELGFVELSTQAKHLRA